jgi:hypothetical protein
VRGGEVAIGGWFGWHGGLVGASGLCQGWEGVEELGTGRENRGLVGVEK